VSGFFSEEELEQARLIVSLYPQKRSALIPLCHLAQEKAGYLSQEAIEEIAEILELSPAEVRGTASFYDMIHLEPVGRYLIGICTNVACLLRGAESLLRGAEEILGVAPGQTTEDGLFTLEETECLAGCEMAPCLQVNHRFFGPIEKGDLVRLLNDLRNQTLADEVPPAGVVSRVKRRRGLSVSLEEVVRQRAQAEAGSSSTDPRGPQAKGAGA
jgi:NADH-quinone oxidoreductase subunit E